MYKKQGAITFNLLLIVILTSLIVACNDNGDTPVASVSSLNLPAAIEVAPANGNQTLKSNASNFINKLITRGAITDPNTDYSNDKVSVFNEDAAKNEVKNINSLLCILDQFKYAEKLNQGPYNIIIDMYDCYSKIFPELIGLIEKSQFVIEGTVNSSRENNNSPQLISAWLTFSLDAKQTTNPAEIQPQLLLEVSIFNSVSTVYPYGNFEMNSAAIEDAGNFGGAVGVEYRAAIDTYQSFLNNNNLPVFKTARSEEVNGGEDHYFSASSIQTSAISKIGAMQTLNSSTNTLNPLSNQSESTLLSFNENNVLTSKFVDPADIITNQSCLSRNEFVDEYWSYNLYHNNDGLFRGNTVSAGDRVNLASHVNFHYLGQYGSISNNSNWLEGDAVLPDGALIVDASNNKQYTAHVVGGTLEKHTLKAVSLTKLHNRQLKYYGIHPIYQKYGTWILNVDANNDFVFVKHVSYGPNGQTLSDTFDHDYNVTTAEVPVAASLTLNDGDSLDFTDEYYKTYWYTHDIQLISVDRVAKVDVSSKINVTNTDLFSGDVTSLALYCYDICPRGGQTQNDVDMAFTISDLYHRYGSFNSTPVTYSLITDGFKLQLVDDSNNLPVDFSMLDLTKVGAYAIYSGMMTVTPLPLTATSATLDQQEVTYKWTTNDQFYYQTVTLTDSGNALVVLDEPISIEYTHDAANDITNTDPNTNLYHGQTFSLTFSGDYLSGLPYSYDNNSYYHTISLADGTLLSSTEGDFVTRARLIGQNLQVKPLSDCGSLDLEPLLQNPSLTLMTADEIPTVSFSAADKPKVNSPAVISP